MSGFKLEDLPSLRALSIQVVIPDIADAVTLRVSNGLFLAPIHVSDKNKAVIDALELSNMVRARVPAAVMVSADVLMSGVITIDDSGYRWSLRGRELHCSAAHIPDTEVVVASTGMQYVVTFVRASIPAMRLSTMCAPEMLDRACHLLGQRIVELKREVRRAIAKAVAAALPTVDIEHVKMVISYLRAQFSAEATKLADMIAQDIGGVITVCPE